MTNIKRICVFCGSSPGRQGVYLETARSLGITLVQRRYTLVYGGAKVGLMGAVADAVLQNGGQVIGVIPSALKAKEVAHEGLSELRVVASMHERKQQMADLADGFIALPGGIGTIEELAEIFTWAQLGLHAKPVGILNVECFYDSFIRFLDHAVSERFLKEQQRAMLLVANRPDDLMDQFENYKAPRIEKWIDRTSA